MIHKDVIRNDIFFQEVQEGAHALSKCFNYTEFFFHLFRPGPVVQSVARLTEESEAPDSIPGPVYI